VAIERLGAIDVLSPANVGALASALESLGYYRYWLTEHHSPQQSGSPMLMAAIAAASTSRLRIGTAGAMLPYYNLPRLASETRLLRSLFPDRFEFGVINGRVRDPILHNRMLDGVPLRDYPAAIRYLMSMVTGSFSIGDEDALPTELEDFWICSTSPSSATLAGELGSRFAYHHYLAAGVPLAESLAIVDQYREQWSLRRGTAPPPVVLVCYGCCAQTEWEARERWAASIAQKGHSWPLPTTAEPRLRDRSFPCFLGSGPQCVAQLEELANVYGTTDIVLQSLAPSFPQVVESYALIAAEQPAITPSSGMIAGPAR